MLQLTNVTCTAANFRNMLIDLIFSVFYRCDDIKDCWNSRHILWDNAKDSCNFMILKIYFPLVTFFTITTQVSRQDAFCFLQRFLPTMQTACHVYLYIILIVLCRIHYMNFLLRNIKTQIGGFAREDIDIRYI